MNQFNTLSEDLMSEMVTFNSSKKISRIENVCFSDKHSFALSNKDNYLHVYLKKMIPHRKIYAWLQDINPLIWALKKMKFTDQNGRSYQPMSWYIYALYTLDTGLQRFIEDCCNNHNVILELKKQHQEFLESGVTYTLNNTETSSKIFEIMHVINNYISLIQNSKQQCNNSTKDITLNVRREDWQEFCISQSQLPKHMFMELCKKDGFSPKAGGLPALDNTRTVANKYYTPDFQTGYGGNGFAIIYNETPPNDCSRYRSEFSAVEFQNMESIIRLVRKETIGNNYLFWIGVLMLLVGLPSATSTEKSFTSWCAVLIATGFFAFNPPVLVEEKDGKLPKDYYAYPTLVDSLNLDSRSSHSLQQNLNMFKILANQRLSELNEATQRILPSVS